MAYHSWKPNIKPAPICPRCDSSNTKFCYYNNYSLTQPRYFCKGCKRYWTKGGATFSLLPYEGSTIDLVLIYTKFVNQRPELNSNPVVHEVPGEIMDESFSVIGGAQNSAMNQMPGQGLDQLGGREITEAPFENETYTEDSNFSLDPGSSESGAFSSEGVVTGNDIPVSECWIASTTSPGFQPLLRDDMFHHQDLVIGDWYSWDQFYNLDY